MTTAQSKTEFMQAYEWHVNCLSTLWHSTDNKEQLKRLVEAQDTIRDIIQEVAEELDFAD